MIYLKQDIITIRSMVKGDAQILFDTYLSYGWHPDLETYENYFKDQTKKTRLVFIAEFDGSVTGIGTLVLNPVEGPFGYQKIPEIVDLGVFSEFQNRGIGSLLMQVMESEAAKRSKGVYLAVGLHAGYGAAQRIYVKRGYIPDGSGVWYGNKPLEKYAHCENDDDLLLFLYKELTN
jgi:GNAT superfamily N-acetyltransferase